MPKIIKDQPKKNQKVVKKATPKLNLPKLTNTKAKAKTKSQNTREYYKCMCHNTPGKNITLSTGECKTNALTINAKVSAQKAHAVKKIKEGYEQLGKGLTEFIKVS
jgi:hypothetical protein